jgi:hypothetical protein
MTRLVLALLSIVIGAGPALAADQPAEIGQIYIIDGCEGYVIATFPSGQRIVYIGKQSIWRYREGDEIRIDAFGRPLPPT